MLTHPKQPKKTTTSGPEPGFSGPRTWVWARCGHFGGCFVRPDVVMFVAQHQGFGPDVFILKCSSRKSRRDHEHRGVLTLRLDRPHVPSAWRRRCRPLPLGLKIRQRRRGPGRSPSLLEVYLYKGWRHHRRPPNPVHHRTSVSPRAPPGPHPETAPKFTRAPTANPHGTEGFLRHFWGPQEPPKCAS